MDLETCRFQRKWPPFSDIHLESASGSRISSALISCKGGWLLIYKGSAGKIRIEGNLAVALSHTTIERHMLQAIAKKSLLAPCLCWRQILNPRNT
jgi:hypothetical protein